MECQSVKPVNEVRPTTMGMRPDTMLYALVNESLFPPEVYVVTSTRQATTMWKY